MISDKKIIYVEVLQALRASKSPDKLRTLVRRNIQGLFDVFVVLLVLIVGAGMVNALVLQPGEVKEVAFGLQNTIGGEDIKVRAVLTSGSEIAEFVDESNEYL